MARTGRPTTSTHNVRPYQLHALLLRHHIPQQDLRRAVVYETGLRAGQPLASSTLSQLLTRRMWLHTLSPDAIRAQVATFLRSRGVPEDEIATAWVPEGGTEELVPSTEGDDSPADHHAELDSAPFDDFQLPEAEMLSQEARQHFGLARHPFVDDVQCAQDVFLSADQRYIRESMYYAAKHGGFVAVIGESGSGKSTLRRDLLERIRRDDEPIVVIQPRTVDKRELTTNHICDAIIHDISTEVPRLSKEAKARQVERLLSANARTGVSHVLLIEEAHDLNKNTLRYLKRFWELEDGFKKLLGIILVGQNELGQLLNERINPDIREVIRRIEQATLKPLNSNLENYLELKFKRVGAKASDVCEPDVYDAIRARLTQRRMGSTEVVSNVYPLVVQNLMVKAMNQVVELGMDKISAELVGRL